MMNTPLKQDISKIFKLQEKHIFSWNQYKALTQKVKKQYVSCIVAYLFLCKP